MWVEKTKNNKFKFCERYTDPLTLKQKKVSVTLDKNNSSSEKLAFSILQDKINAAQSSSDVSFLTFSSFADKYLAYQEKAVKPSTFKRNSFFVKQLTDIISGDIIVQNITARHVRAALDATGKANSTKNEFLKRYKALMRWGYANDYVDDVRYLDKLTPYKDNRKERIQDKYLEEEEVAALMNDIKSTSHTLWIDLTEFLLLSGLRIGEAMVLNKSDIHNEYIKVTKTYELNVDVVSEEPKTSQSNRDVYIQPELRDVLNRIKMHNKLNTVTSPLLFSSPDGSHIKYSNYRMFLERHSQKVLGRKITPHALRHTHASLLFANGVPLDTVTRRLGHSDSEVTREIYIHITEKLKQHDNDLLKDIKII